MDKLRKEDFISLNEAASIYGYTRDHLGYLIRQGDLKGEKLGSFYFTKHDWIKEYLLKSGKARKQEMRIKQGDKRIDQGELRMKNYELRKKPLIILKEFRAEVDPLIKDFGDLAKNSRKVFKNAIHNLKKFSFQNSAFTRETIQELTIRQREVRYLTKRLNKTTDRTKIIDSSIKSLRRIIDFFIWVPLQSLAEIKENLAINRQRIKRISNKTFDFAGRLQRELFWNLSYRPKISQISIPKSIKIFRIDRKAIATISLCFGILITGLGFYPIFSQTHFYINLSCLTNLLDKASEPVYLSINSNHQFQALKNIASDLGHKINQTDAILSYDNLRMKLTENSGERRGKIEKYFADLRKQSTVFTYNTGILSIYTKKTAQNLTEGLNKISQNFPHFNIAKISNIVSRKTNNALIVFETETKKGVNRINGEIKGMQGMIIQGMVRLKERLWAWQARNNYGLAQMDNRLVQIKKVALANINGGVKEQLAQLRISFDFIVKPLARFGNFMSNFFHHNDQRIAKLEEKITKLENQKMQTTVVVPGAEQTQEGLIVIPSTENDEANKEKIKAAFSDEVTVEPDKTGKSGIIWPIFRKVTEQKYLYLLVPITGK